MWNGLDQQQVGRQEEGPNEAYLNRHILLVRAIHNTYHITASGTQLRCRGGATAARRPRRPCSAGQPPPRPRTGSPPTSCSGCTSGGTTIGTGPRVRVATVIMCHECLNSLHLIYIRYSMKQSRLVHQNASEFQEVC